LPIHHVFGIGPGTQARQTATAMQGYADLLVQVDTPDAIVVPGDVNGSMACALVGAKLGIPVVHLEAGLRSGDRSMPEEINRIVIDAVSSLLWTPSEDASKQLKDEGVATSKIEKVGNIMIDTLVSMDRQTLAQEVYAPHQAYALVTLHRPSNVDNSKRLTTLLAQLRAASSEIKIVFPLHPRTEAKVMEQPRASIPQGVCKPMRYVDFMAHLKNATIVITDSGGVQEEAAYLGVPCATVRDNTERPITINRGSNRLIQPDEIVASIQKAKRGEWPASDRSIPRWDGGTADRCVTSLKQFLLPQKGLE
jgi:UDP-N-acetylglucosamine 2-epimerase (non-hydrolysing)